MSGKCFARGRNECAPPSLQVIAGDQRLGWPRVIQVRRIGAPRTNAADQKSVRRSIILVFAENLFDRLSQLIRYRNLPHVELRRCFNYEFLPGAIFIEERHMVGGATKDAQIRYTNLLRLHHPPLTALVTVRPCEWHLQFTSLFVKTDHYGEPVSLADPLIVE